MIKVTASFTLEDHNKTVVLKFLDNATQKEIEEEIERDFWDWVQRYDYGWHIVKQERTNNEM